MKEVLTKSFWRGVTKTFYQALEGPPAPQGSASQIPAEAAPQASKEGEVKPPPSVGTKAP